MSGRKRTALRVLTEEILTAGSAVPNAADSGLTAKQLRRIKRAAARESDKLADHQQQQHHWVRPESVKMNHAAFTGDFRSSLRLDTFNDDDEIEDLVEYLHSCDRLPDRDYDEGRGCCGADARLPRSFLLDAIHEAAAEHCLFMHSLAGRSIERRDCPSPAERRLNRAPQDRDYSRKVKFQLRMAAKAFAQVDEYRLKAEADETAQVDSEKDDDRDSSCSSRSSGRSRSSNNSSSNSIKSNSYSNSDISFNSSSDIHSNNNNNSSSSSDNAHVTSDALHTSDIDSSDSDTSKPPTTPRTASPPPNPVPPGRNPNFPAMAKLLCEDDDALAEVDAYDFSGDLSSSIGADALWSLDPSALLAFGWAAEAFIERMLYYHSSNQQQHSDSGNDSDGSYSVLDLEDDDDDDDDNDVDDNGNNNNNGDDDDDYSDDSLLCKFNDFDDSDYETVEEEEEK